MLEKYSADALRYWAASATPGKEAIINEKKFQMGSKLVTKLWNVARFAEPFLPSAPAELPQDACTAADRWILARCARLVERVTADFEGYDYAAARGEIEDFFWRDLADNYLEMAKLRLYDAQHPAHAGASYALKTILRTTLKLLAPLLPYVTEAIWLELFSAEAGDVSIHRSAWPEAHDVWMADAGSLLGQGEMLIAIATAVRRYKSEHALSLGSELASLAVAVDDEALKAFLETAQDDLAGITRAKEVQVGKSLSAGFRELAAAPDGLHIGIQ
jgi:valyl-tRNA synthetase